jgi:hypothetical protein
MAVAAALPPPDPGIGHNEPAIDPWMTGLFCCGNDASLPQHNKQVTRSMGELRSLAIGVSQRDPFVELIDVTAEDLIAHGG